MEASHSSDSKQTAVPLHAEQRRQAAANGGVAHDHAVAVVRVLRAVQKTLVPRGQFEELFEKERGIDRKPMAC